MVYLYIEGEYMKLEDITAEQVDAWLNKQFELSLTQNMDDEWLANVSMKLEDMSAIARTTSFTSKLALFASLQKKNAKSAILVFGICLGIEYAIEATNMEDVKCQTLQ